MFRVLRSKKEALVEQAPERGAGNSLLVRYARCGLKNEALAEWTAERRPQQVLEVSCVLQSKEGKLKRHRSGSQIEKSTRSRILQS